MSLADSAVFAQYNYSRKTGAFDFYRCYKCNGIFTREQEMYEFARAARNPNDRLRMCPCGSVKYSPSFPRFWEWPYWPVLRYTVKLTLARGLAPWLDKHFPKALPLVERMVRFKEV